MNPRKYIPLIAGMLALGTGPATDAVKSASDLFYNRRQSRIERRVEAPSSSRYRLLEDILGAKAYAQEVPQPAQPTVIQVYDFATGQVTRDQSIEQRLVGPNETVEYLGSASLSNGVNKTLIGVVANDERDNFYAVGATRSDIHQVVSSILPIERFDIQSEALRATTVRIGPNLSKIGIVWRDDTRIYLVDLNRTPYELIRCTPPALDCTQFMTTLLDNKYPAGIVAVNSENSRFTRSDGTIGYTSPQDDILYVERRNGKYSIFRIDHILAALQSRQPTVTPIEDNVDLEALFGDAPDLGPVRSIAAFNNGSLVDNLAASRSRFSGRIIPRRAADLVNDNQALTGGILHRWVNLPVSVYADPSVNPELADRTALRAYLNNGFKHNLVDTPNADIVFRSEPTLTTPGFAVITYFLLDNRYSRALILLAPEWDTCDFYVPSCAHTSNHEFRHASGIVGQGLDHGRATPIPVQRIEEHRIDNAIRTILFGLPNVPLILNTDGTYSAR